MSPEERWRIAAFIGESEDSPVSILLRRLLTATDNGIDATVLSDDSEATPNQAAELLNMSRPHLLTFMNRGLLPFHRVGTHRRIKTADLIAFMRGRKQGAAIVAGALGNLPSTAVTRPTDRRRTPGVGEPLKRSSTTPGSSRGQILNIGLSKPSYPRTHSLTALPNKLISLYQTRDSTDLALEPWIQNTDE